MTSNYRNVLREKDRRAFDEQSGHRKGYMVTWWWNEEVQGRRRRGRGSRKEMQFEAKSELVRLKRKWRRICSEWRDERS